MSGQGRSTTTPIDAAVDDVLLEIEQKRSAEEYRAASIARMTAAIQAGAVSGYSAIIAAMGREGLDMLAQAPGAVDAMTTALLDAAREGRRLLALLGVDLPPDADDGAGV